MLQADESSNSTVADLPNNYDLENELNISSGQEQGVIGRTFRLKELYVVV